jgi:cyclic dehypoxanthinyl futalosine synthase
MLEENVVSSAGARHRSNRSELIHLIRSAGRTPAQRSTTYELLAVHENPADDPADDRVRSHIASTALTVVD